MRIWLFILVSWMIVPRLCAGELQDKNKEVVKLYFHQVLDGKQFSLIPVLYAKDAVIQFPGRPILKGPAAMESAVRDALSKAVSFRTTIVNLVAEGDIVVAQIEHDARYEPGFVWRNRAGVTPAQMPVASAHWTAMTLFRIVQGKIVEQQVSRDELGVLLENGAVSVSPFGKERAAISLPPPVASRQATSSY
jgi:hypothetical protein